MSQSEEEYEYGHQTEDEEHFEDEEVSLEELEEEADENEEEAPDHVTSREDLEEEHDEEDLDVVLKNSDTLGYGVDDSNHPKSEVC